jgi:outer membrane protein OmpA-like peptidoglycan-associated protein
MFASDRIVAGHEGATYGWTGNNYLRLYCSEPTIGGDLTSGFPPPVLGPDALNQGWHDGPVCFNKSFTEIFINRTILYHDKGKKEHGNFRTHLLKIYTAVRNGEQWSKPEPFFLNSDDYSVGHPALSPDGRTLFFVSDMPGGFGGTDLYMCTMEGGKWGNPVNLGAIINTFGNEMFPYIAENGDLYFASDGLPGFGGLDVFVSRKINGQWTRPENLGLPINSSCDDFAMILGRDGVSGLFSSNRPGGMGSDDIYSFRKIRVNPKPEIPVASVSGYVKDRTTKEPIPAATVFLAEEGTGKVLVLKTNTKGYFKTPVRKGKSYTIKAIQTKYTEDCYPFAFDSLNKQNDLSIPRDLLLEKLEVNRAYRLDNIYYDFDKWNIRNDAQPALDYLVNIMRENPVTIELGSHTDCRGSVEYNKELSQKRAESAVRYIANRGIGFNRIVAKGYGKSQLLNKCNCEAGVTCTKAEHQLNRRTEFKILSWAEEKPDAFLNPDNFKDGDILEVKNLPVDFFDSCK